MEMLRKGTFRTCLILLLALCLLAAIPLTTLAATYGTCTEAKNAATTAIQYGTTARQVMDLIINVIETNSTASSMFKGSSTSSMVKKLALGMIEDELENNKDMVEPLGFNVSSQKSMLSEELWVAACIYYDNGKTEDAVNLGIQELIRFFLEKLNNVTDSSVAANYYDIYKYSLTHGEAAAISEETKKASGHSYGSWAEYSKATCTTPGKNYRTCSGCGATEYQDTATADHSPVTDPAVEATCTETGKTEGSHCGTCGTVIKAQETITATGHTPVTDPAVEATCTETGLTEGSHCGTCSAVIKAQETTPTTEHTYSTIKNDSTGHWGVCSCTAVTEVESHTDTDGNDLCDVCSYVMERPKAPEGLGDADGDGYATSIDASLVLQYDVQLIDESKLNLSKLDLNGDGEVNSIDASLILQFDVKLITSFPVQNQK